MPDPSQVGLERWWDGQRWTTRTRDAVTLIEGPPPAWRAPAAPYRAAQRSAWRLQVTEQERASFSLGRVAGTVTAIVVIAALVLVFDTPFSRALHAYGFLPDDALSVVAAADSAGAVPAAKPVPAVVEHPVTGSTELVRYLEAAMIAREESIDIASWAAGAEGVAAVEDAMLEALTQNPYVFVQGWQTLTLNGRAVSLEPEYVYDAEETRARQDATAAAVDQALAVLDLGALGPADQVTAIHDYVAQAATYDYEAADLINAGERNLQVAQSQEAYGILVAGSAVCNGYAQAFKAIADAAGLEVVTVTGQAWSGPTSGGHAWNRVMIDGRWLVVDATWDDGGDLAPVPDDYLMVEPGDPALITRDADQDWAVDGSIAGFGG
ncbi:transglutaminase domain-containing protein [Demequina lignilytica]|uniref:Transglutaminase domain-containing protein n=1 Tax=Demequina lignilytica TaxID=3051663 RepID=A0AB35MJS6_9MICO|nr:transglutaminase domain-containing protein [Demequina sp. SYSU T0a273]MDN4484028.1 transglutaminase domain-containing protein [Demequina sp. SYSU T0a273]